MGALRGFPSYPGKRILKNKRGSAGGRQVGGDRLQYRQGLSKLTLFLRDRQFLFGDSCLQQLIVYFFINQILEK